MELQEKLKEIWDGCDEAIKLDPRCTEAYNNRGSAKSHLGKHEEAIKDYDQALESDPKTAVAYHSRGIAKIELGRHKEAQKDFSEARRLNPDGEGRSVPFVPINVTPML